MRLGGSQPRLLMRGRRDGWYGRAVVGETHYRPHLSSLIGPEITGERFLRAELRAEPRNRFDRNAVAVLIDGGKVGYIAAEEAPEFRSLLQRVAGWNYVPEAAAKLWWHRYDGGEPSIAVHLDLHHPAYAVPINWPDPQLKHYVMPTMGTPFQLSGEELAMEELTAALKHAHVPGAAACYVTLHPARVTRGKATSRRLEARLNGATIGTCSKQTGDRMFSLLDPLWAGGTTVYAEAHLHGNELAVQVSVFLKYPEKLTPDEVTAVRALAM